MSSLLGAILIGLVAGAIAKFLMPGKDPGGIIITILLGVVGAVVASYLGQWLNIYEEGQQAGLIGAVVGAMLLLLIYRLFKKSA
ncbi:MAG: GlsB/YeaQ/YmgE family stress response membrane protein [Calditrichaceae bacterium]|nr:GlsB/YeaQ/YmgE family stress response membrane protein [Calditrichia bacterium]NUQ40364.1 GlsB/YeaQ/YmgE family stress response membrane protein [Calditrichaceae bacterium]